ncbi:MAG: ABC transporter ATP-binding protein [Alphaproteobacteria bacterium]|nr:ABC transporter ATP-binding protein [Alphaproteobacteria bacterium]
MSEVLLNIENVTKTFGGFTALSKVSAAVKKGERFGLIGPNGSGKTTLINCISGMLQNNGGSIIFDGKDLKGLQPHQRTKRGIARTFQIPRPFHSMTVIQNLQIPLEFVSSSGTSQKNISEEAMSILEVMSMEDKAHHETSGLTQIELRKLELARAIAVKPKLLVSDEAMAGLTGNEVDEVLEILVKLNEDGMTIIMIEHIMRAVMQFSHRIICLDAGQKIADGLPEVIVKDPAVERAYLGV